ncbi:MAG: hypothetical protein ABIJ26_03100 [Candidatus Margulisiibacteriota bacterium]
MKSKYLIFFFIFAILMSAASGKAFAIFGFFEEDSPIATPAPATEPAVAPTPETVEPTAEKVVIPTPEAVTASPEASPVAPAPTPQQEGSTYKDVPWGADFNRFKEIKGFAGSPSLLSAEITGTADDNDIAILLGAPISEKDSSGTQRVMFEYVPRKFASVYYEPDDTYYVFYDGKFALTFSRINTENFDLYRDTFYKKYNKLDSFTARYELGPKKSALLQSAIFEKGQTQAFLIRSTITIDKKAYAAGKLIFADMMTLPFIRKEIEDKVAADTLGGHEKSRQQLEKDLLKIE